MYKISSLEAGARFKFYGHTYELGAMEWNTGHPKFKDFDVLMPQDGRIGVDIRDCYLVSNGGSVPVIYWIDANYEVEVIEPVKSKLADLSMTNKIERLERAVASHNDKIDTLFGHANNINTLGVVTDIVNLQNAIKKIEADKASFDVVAEIRKLQNRLSIINSNISTLIAVVATNEEITKSNEAQNANIFGEISARLDKLDMVCLGGVLTANDYEDLPKPEYAPGTPPVPQIGWRKIDPENLPSGHALFRGTRNDGSFFIKRGIISKNNSVAPYRVEISRVEISNFVFCYGSFDRYMLDSDLVNLPEIE